jgi:hypothetical protein
MRALTKPPCNLCPTCVLKKHPTHVAMRMIAKSASKKPMPFLALLYGFRKYVGVTGECASRSLLKAEVKE